MNGKFILAAMALAMLTQTASAVTPRAAEDAASPVGSSLAPLPKAQKTIAAEKKSVHLTVGHKAGAIKTKATKKRRH